MMTQLQVICTRTDSLSIAQAKKEQYVHFSTVKVPLSDLRAPLSDATQDILRHAEFLASEKSRSKTEYKKLLSDLGWKGEEKKYLKVAAVFENFSPQDLANIEPATIFLLANNSKKYQPVIDELLDLPEITQASVRSLIAAHRTPQEPNLEEPSIWRRTKNGARYCQIPPIHEQDEQTGVILQRAMDERGLLPQAVVREAMELWQDYQDGRLVAVEAATLPKEMPTFVEPVSQYEDLLTQTDSVAKSNACAPWAIAIQEIALSPYELEEFDALKHLSGADSWTFEPEQERDDDTLEYADYACPALPQDVQTERSPIELLIHTFQTAASWREISEVLKIHGKYKQLAWDELTPLERRRITELTPTEVKKLNQAQKAGKIVDFREVRDDVYQIKHHGCLFWGEAVSKSRLDSVLARL